MATAPPTQAAWVSELAESSVEVLIESIASCRIAPGAGSAAAVVLALGAACARKAALVSLKHRPDDERLQQAARTCEVIAREALSGADKDAREFERLLRSQDKAAAAAQLLELGHRLERRAEEVLRLAASMRPLVIRPVIADLDACEAFARAAKQVEVRNLEDN
jgi:formiminotetrahydrofolate cyclodeaminase